MTDMVERVAVALANYDADLVDVPHIGSLREFRFDHDRDEYVRRARAAIEAMRDPSDGMVAAGDACDERIPFVSTPLHAAESEVHWRAMIDAALSQSGEDSLPPRDAV